MKIRRLAFPFLGLLALGACAESGFEIHEEGYELADSLEQVLPSALAIAHEWEENAYLASLGAGYTILDREGKGHNHSFQFYSRRNERRLDVHLFSGMHWSESEIVPRTEAPAPIYEIRDPMPSSEIIPLAIAAAEDSFPRVFWNNTNPDGWIIDEDLLSARLFPEKSWPERISADEQADSVAWRVDFLESRVTDGTPRWWSVMRVYLRPETGEVFEVIDPTDRPPQVYPNL